MTAPLEMNPEIRERWAAALRSGEYEQTRDHLRDQAGFCCLGVLCELAVRDKVLGAARIGRHDIYRYDDETDELPESVMEWAGLIASNPKVSIGRNTADLTGLNDRDRWDFARIADAIEGVTP